MSGCELGFMDEGLPDAPALVLLGSLGSTNAMWEAVMPQLRDHVRVIRIEHWGHGTSAIPTAQHSMADLTNDVLDVLDKLKVERAHVAGVSLGGMVAIELAAHHADRIASATLICTSARLPNRRAFAQRATIVRTQGMQAIASAVVERWLTPPYAKAHEAQVKALRDMVQSIDAEGYAACCEAIASWGALDELATIQVPTCVIVSAQDQGITPANGYLLAETIPHARLVVLQDAAHIPVLEQPDAVTDALLQHALGRDTQPMSERDTFSSRSERGQAVRRAVLGDAHVDQAIARTNEFTAPFQDLVRWYPWGSVWSRPGLSRVERSMITLCVLASLGHHQEFTMHVRAALRNGVTVEQLQEALLHLAVYAGIPVANHAFALADQVLRDEGLVPAPAENENA